jgi:hypothetical protein
MRRNSAARTSSRSAEDRWDSSVSATRSVRCSAGCRVSTASARCSPSRRFGWAMGNPAAERPVGRVEVSRAVAGCCTAASTRSTTPIVGEFYVRLVAGRSPESTLGYFAPSRLPAMLRQQLAGLSSVRHPRPWSSRTGHDRRRNPGPALRPRKRRRRSPRSASSPPPAIEILSAKNYHLR